MGKYKTNLIDKIEQTDNQVKWLIIIITAVVMLVIIFIGIHTSEKLKKQNKRTEIVFTPSESMKQVEQPKEEEDIIEIEEPVEVVEKAKIEPKQRTTPKEKERTKVPVAKPTKAKPKQKLNKRFENSFNGFKITGVAVSRNASTSIVYLKRDGEEEKMKSIGDVINGYTIKEIHRTYIILKNSNDTIHLNKLH